MICRLCQFDNSELVYTHTSAPDDVSTLLEKPKKNEYIKNLIVFKCMNCGFIFTPPIYNQSYYDTYCMTLSHSKLINQLQKTQVQFLSRLVPVGRNILEIGCGDGTFMEILNRHGYTTVGLEPSKKFYTLALNKGLNVINKYLNYEEDLHDISFDCFIMRQVLEHVIDFINILQILYRKLNTNGIGFVEIPSISLTLREKRFYDFFSDHVNYFDTNTISRLIHNIGFEIINLRESFSDNYLEIWVRKKDLFTWQKMILTRNSIISQISRIYENCKLNSQKWAIWGAGAKGVTIIHATASYPPDFIFDTDINKHGKFIADCNVKISPPNLDSLRSVSYIVLTAMSHWTDIICELREKLTFAGEIYIIKDKLIAI